MVEPSVGGSIPSLATNLNFKLLIMAEGRDGLHRNYVIVFFDEDKKSRQVIHPTVQFDGDWKGLVDSVTNGEYYLYRVI